ncbi:MAG: hypothetical protein M1828_000373 [Chrysothrix sp. TS-e1954]|nr:MAG: hypothetical protein M1828_000373 [Chrysothrix sp. TS-e1954]
MLGSGYKVSTSDANEASDMTALDVPLVELLVSLRHSCLLSPETRQEQVQEMIVRRTRLLEKVMALIQGVGSAKTDFRDLQGFEILETMFSQLPDMRQSAEAAKLTRDLHDFSTVLLTVLSDCLWEHPSNLAYFNERTAPGGWSLVSTAISSFAIDSSCTAVSDEDFQIHAKLTATLFHAAFRSQGLDAFINSIATQQLHHHSRLDPETGDGRAQLDTGLTSNLASRQWVKRDVRALREALQYLWVPRIIQIILDIVIGTLAILETAPALMQFNEVVITCITESLRQSEHNAVEIQTLDLLAKVLRVQISLDSKESLSDAFAELSEEMMRFGLNQHRDAVDLVRSARTSVNATRALSNLTRLSREPPRFHFDMALAGHASIEFASLPRRFPPQDPSTGYTFTTYVKIDHFDAKAHITLFGAFDPSQTCFLLVYLERDTRQLVLQTSVTSSKPSVRFKSVSFSSGVWYHIAIVHRLARVDRPSRAALFVNGDFCEQLNCGYPAICPSQDATRYKDASRNERRRPEPKVQAFLGTPKDLSPRLGRNQIRSTWALANVYLISDILPDELIFVYKHLGPHYYGNYQDCLGSFQTYQASAALNIRNEILHPASQENSLITAALRSKAGRLNDEQNYLLSLSTAGVVEGKKAEANTGTHESQLTDITSKRIVVNNAIPRISIALTKDYGFGILTDAVTVCRPRRFEDLIASTSGCVGPSLDLLGRAETSDHFSLALRFVFDLVRESWRNSESFERESGFAFLAWLLKQKVDLIEHSEAPLDAFHSFEHAQLPSLAYRTLQGVLKFVGHDADRPEKSVIANPLAYRALLVDAEVWRGADNATNTLFYHQFSVFARQSEHRLFNIKRLNRMRIVKRFLDTARAGKLPLEVLPAFSQAFRVIVCNSLTSDIHRSLALFITYAVASANQGSMRGARIDETYVQADHSQHKKFDSDSTSLFFGQSNKGKAPSAKASMAEVGFAILEQYADIMCQDTSNVHVRKFAKTVTNKFLLYLLSSDSERVITAAMKILAKILVIHGSAYVQKFEQSTKGFIIVLARLKRWWYVPSIWTLCFAILFGKDVAGLKTDAPFDALYLLLACKVGDQLVAICPSIFRVITGLYEHGLRVIVGSLSPGKDTSWAERSAVEFPQNSESILVCACRFLTMAIDESDAFSTFLQAYPSMKELLRVLFAPHKRSHDAERSLEPLPLQNSQEEKSDPETLSFDMGYPRSSYVVVSSKVTHRGRQTSALVAPLATGCDSKRLQMLEYPAVAVMLELLTTLSVRQVVSKTDFSGLGLFLKAPACAAETRSLVTSILLRRTLQRLQKDVEKHSESILEPRALANLVRFFTQATEAFHEGWFVDDHGTMISCLGEILALLDREDVQQLKKVRLCSPTITALRTCFQQVTISWVIRQSHPAHPPMDLEASKNTMNNLRRYCGPLFTPRDAQDASPVILLSLFWHVLAQVHQYEADVLNALASLLQYPQTYHSLECSSPIIPALESHQNFVTSFNDQLRHQDRTWTEWASGNEQELQTIDKAVALESLNRFIEPLSFQTMRSARARLQKREQRLETWHLEELMEAHAWTEHEASAVNWFENIHSSELLKITRSRQDVHENFRYLACAFETMLARTRYVCSDIEINSKVVWQLDECEGRDRVRLRLHPSRPVTSAGYNARLNEVQSLLEGQVQASPEIPLSRGVPAEMSTQDTSNDPATLVNDDFELVRPSDGLLQDDEDDKNRKVMRSLQRGEEVQNVHNASIILGLEAYSTLVIVGQKALYLLGNLFQRSDGEIVSISQAPTAERDSYAWSISGHRIDPKNEFAPSIKSTVNHWQWKEIISFSKRRFLLRDVALELFFRDGRSYLVTLMKQQDRDDFFADLSNRCRVSRSQTPSDFDDAWRAALLPGPDDTTRSLGSRLTNAFSPVTTNRITRQWLRGELSNFHYLMMVNTMAGRTFNDLTQYPVFPWVLADYTSDELDLTNPRTFRDLSKPMGCQSPEREASFRERYWALADMTDDSSPSFHYGTHYSSAMIVASFLIRLQPFVTSYLLLQGGRFDHADRLFYSVERAWSSASKDTFSDVRELTPEFYYLPDFLRNLNGFDFGQRGNGEPVNHVSLPPWAKGSAALFIAKQREALESVYVSQNLHHWIDLIFGFKQQGEAALEATNKFHHLSYRGAIDLDTIQDDHERTATIGIIHNFGQTPHQIFSRPHERHDHVKPEPDRVHERLISLTRIPSPIYGAYLLSTVSKQ